MTQNQNGNGNADKTFDWRYLKSHIHKFFISIITIVQGYRLKLSPKARLKYQETFCGQQYIATKRNRQAFRLADLANTVSETHFIRVLILF